MQPLDSVQWARVKELVADGFELEPEERAAFLDRLAGEPVEVREAAARLLRATGAEGTRVGPLGLRAARAPRDFAGRVVGTFRVERFLGRGGMGEVYAAVQQGTGRRVALKLLARESELDRKRFEQEGRLLGRLEHPHIAQVVDAAVHVEPDGSEWPFIALEFVEGLPITEHARARRSGVEERVALVIDAALAVEHAHRAGIVHRDLKPENLLVRDGDPALHPSGDVRVVDFGVATLVGDANAGAELTRPGDVIGTLQYMSPEQAAGGAVDRRTDVYGLGVVLFELLTGRLPFERAGSTFVETLERIRDAAVPSLAEFERHLRGDLDTIVATALAKDPARRYASCAEFAADLRRFLDSKPITARPPNRWHRARLVVRRHRALVVSIAGTVTILLVAAIASGVAWRRAVAQERHARDVADFLGAALSQASPDGLGREVTVRELLGAIAAEVPERFRDRPVTANRLDLNVGWALYAQGDLHGAVDIFERAGRRARAHFPATSLERFEPEASAVIVGVLVEGDPAAMLGRIRTLIARADAIGPAARLLRHRLAVAEARALDANGQLYEAIAALEGTVLALREHRDRGGEDYVAEAQSTLGALLHRAGETERALEWAERTLADSIASHGPRSPSALFDGISVAALRSQLGMRDVALAQLDELVPAIEATFGAGSPAHLDVLRSRAATLSQLGAHARAAADLERVVSASDEVLGPRERATLLALNNLAHVRRRLGDPEEAERLARTLVARAEAGGVGVLDVAASGELLLATLRRESGDAIDAARLAGSASARLDATLGPDHGRSLDALAALADHRRAAGDAEGAARDYRELLGRCRRAAPSRTRVQVDAAWALAGLCLELRESEDVLALLDEIERIDADQAISRAAIAERRAQAERLTGDG